MTKASAVKRGRNPKFPYIPVVIVPGHRFPGDTRTHDTNTRAAFATRVEAVAFAQKWIDANTPKESA